MYAVELARTLRRGRTWLLAAIVATVPVIIVVAVWRHPPRPSGSSAPAFLFPIVTNGFFAALSSISVIQPYLLPLLVGMLVGESIAGEAQAGTLRALLIRPVRRDRLVLAKYAAAMTLVAAAVVLTIVVAVLSGAIAFGVGPMSTLSGTTLTTAASVARLALATAFAVAAVSGVASIGMWISTRTDNGPVAAVLTAAVAIVSQILDRVPSLDRLAGYLPTHGWTGYIGLFRYPVDMVQLQRGLVISAAYTVVFLTLAVVGFRHRDVLV